MQFLLSLLPLILWIYNTYDQICRYLLARTGPLVMVRSGDSKWPQLSCVGRTVQYLTGRLPRENRTWITTIYLPCETITSVLLTGDLTQDVREIIANANDKQLPRRKNIMLYAPNKDPVVKDLGVIDRYYRHLHRRSVVSLTEVTQALGLDCHEVSITEFRPPKISRLVHPVKSLSISDLYYEE